MARLFEKLLLTVVIVVFLIVGVVFISGIEFASTDDKSAQERITQAEAIAFALDKAPGTVTEVETGMRDGMLYYEVEIVDGNIETDVKVDAETGAVIEIERELVDEDDNEEEKLTEEEVQLLAAGPITEQRAREIAVLAVGGGQAIKVETERERGLLMYEVEVAYQGDIAEVEIDAETGAVIEIEWEDD